MAVLISGLALIRGNMVTNVSFWSLFKKFVNDIGSKYLNEVFQWAAESNRTLRKDYSNLKHPFHKTTAGQNLLSFLGPSKCIKLLESTKKYNNINTFKDNLKKKLSSTTH